MKTILHTFVALALLASVRAQSLYPTFLIPSFDGQPNTEFSSWDVFYAANNGVANYPDVVAPNGISQARSAAGFPANDLEYSPDDPLAFWDASNPTIAQTGGGAFIIGPGSSGNIYSFSEPTEFVLSDSTSYPLGTVVFQFQSSGTVVDFANVRLVYDTGAGEVSRPFDQIIREYTGTGSSFGGVQNRSAVQWDLTGLGVTDYEIRFASETSSLSFQRALLDTADTYSEVVPEARAWDAGGGDANWSTAGNWTTDTVPTAGANVDFSQGTAATLDGDRMVGELNFSAAAGFTLAANAGAKLTVNTGIGATSATAGTTFTVDADVVQGGIHFHEIEAGSRVVLNGDVTVGTRSDGSTVPGGFLKRGGGELVINGDIGSMPGGIQINEGTVGLSGTNSYSGTTNLWGGTLVIGSDAPLNGPGALGTNPSLVEIGLDLSGGSSGIVIPTVARVLIDGGLTVGKNFLSVGGNETVVFGGRDTGAGAEFAGDVTLAESNATQVNAEGVADRVTFGGILSGGASDRTLTKTGDGTVVLAGVNKTYASATRVERGTLEIASGTNVTGGGDWSVGASASLRVDGSIGSGGAFTLDAGRLTGAGSINRAVTIDGGDRLAPGNAAGALTFNGAQTWGAGGTYEFQLSDASGAAGLSSGWDLVDIVGGLTLTADPATPFTLLVTSISLGGFLAPPAGFDPESAYAWEIARASEGVSGFAAEQFVIDAGGFDGGGAFFLTQDGNSLLLNHAPIPEPSTILLLVVATLLAVRPRWCHGKVHFF
jgi:autotransporter-associated beta strand protein